MKKLLNKKRSNIIIHNCNLKMKISSLFIILTFFSLQAKNSLEQKETLSLHLNNVSILQLLNKIETSTSFEFVYKIEDVDINRKVTINCSNEKLSTILLKVFKNTETAFNINDKRIYLTKKVFKKEKTTNNAKKEQQSLKGKTIDAKGQPLAGASIVVKGKAYGTISDFDGNFSINVENGDILSISYMGYIDKEIKYTGFKTIDIVLEEDTALLDEVVVIGYGSVKKEDATGSLSTIKVEEQNRGSVTKTSNLLLGKVPGLQVTMANGDPNTNGVVRIRQGASLNASNSPLVIIDGIIGESLNYLNSEDVDTITVLKDASSTAIYGARGANGVIIVTTKKGINPKDGKGVAPKISYRMDTSINKNVRTLEVYNTDSFKKEFLKRYPDLGNLLGSNSTNWQDEIYRLGISQKNTLAVKGAFPKTPYRLSLGYQDEKGTIKNSEKSLASLVLNISPSALSKHLKADITFKETSSKIPESSSPVQSAAFMDPTAPVFQDYPNNLGLGYYMFGADQNGSLPTNTNNPVASIDLATGNSKNSRTALNANLNYKVHGFEDLTFTANFGLIHNHYNRNWKVLDNSPSSWGNYGAKGIGVYAKNKSYNRSFIREYYANYNHLFNGKHRVKAMLGHTYEEHHNTWENSPVFINGSDEEFQIASSGGYENTLASYFGRLNYDFNRKYFFTFTMRADGSSRFAPETRWGYFPSGAFAWKLNEEKYFEKFSKLSNLKLRLSYGQTGQQDINNNYAYQSTYQASTDDSRYRFGDQFYTTYRPNAYVRDIQWEVTSTYNAGLDWGFADNRVYGSIDYYNRFTDKLLMEDVRIPAGANFSDTLDQNIGEMESSGLEFSIGSKLINNEDLQWSFDTNFTYNKATIKKLTTYNSSNEAFIKTGSIGSSRFAQIHKVNSTPYTFFLAKQAYDNDGTPLDGTFYNPDYDPSVSGSEEFVYDDTNDANKFNTGKSSLAPYYGGFSSALKYKDWDFGVNGHFAFGHYVFWQTASRGSNESLYDTYGLYPKNSLVNTPEWAQEHRFSDYWLHKGDYLKLDNITVGYTIDKIINSNSSLRLSVGIQNVFTITNYPGIDPEVYSGIDGSAYPRPKMYLVTMNMKF